MFPLAEVTVLDISIFDHLPLSLELIRKMYILKTHRFRFESMWVKEKDYLHIIQNCWLEMVGHSITNKIDYCCLQLKEWDGGMVKEFKVKMGEYKRRLKELRSRQDRYGIN